MILTMFRGLDTVSTPAQSYKLNAGLGTTLPVTLPVRLDEPLVSFIDWFRVALT